MIKNFFLIFIFSIAGATVALSQTVNGRPITEIDTEYVDIIGVAKPFSKKVNINIDFGQVDKFFSTKDSQIKDKNGESTTFNSMVDALNFMSKNGYDFVQAYVTQTGDLNTYHYLMKKRKE